jgi:hypothetical protein
MANMSYCRFQNTLQDLRDCLDHMDERLDLVSDSDEYRAKEKLIQLCHDIAKDFGDFDSEDEY